MKVIFFNQNPCKPPWPGVFQRCTEWIDVHFSLRSFNSFTMLLIRSLDCHILPQNCFASLASGCWYVFVLSPPTWWSNFLSLFWNVLFRSYCLTLSRFLFNLPSFTSTFWFISSSCIIIFTFVAFSFLSQHVPAFFIFAYRRIFPICVSCRIYHSGFECLFVALRGIPVFSQTNFAA